MHRDSTTQEGGQLEFVPCATKKTVLKDTWLRPSPSAVRTAKTLAVTVLYSRTQIFPVGGPIRGWLICDLVPGPPKDTTRPQRTPEATTASWVWIPDTSASMSVSHCVRLGKRQQPFNSTCSQLPRMRWRLPVARTSSRGKLRN